LSSRYTPDSECKSEVLAKRTCARRSGLDEREPAQRGLALYRINLEYQREWDGRYYGVQQVAAVVAEEPERMVVVTVYAFYFQEGEVQ
jgi:hypothetical protein